MVIDKSKNFTNLKWEVVERTLTGNGRQMIRRVKIHGGWLVESEKLFQNPDTGGYGVGIAFVPDPKHEWKL